MLIKPIDTLFFSEGDLTCLDGIAEGRELGEITLLDYVPEEDVLVRIRVCGLQREASSSGAHGRSERVLAETGRGKEIDGEMR